MRRDINMIIKEAQMFSNGTTAKPVIAEGKWGIMKIERYKNILAKENYYEGTIIF